MGSSSEILSSRRHFPERKIIPKRCCGSFSLSSAADDASSVFMALDIFLIAVVSPMSSASISLWVGRMTSPPSSWDTIVQRTYCLASSPGFSLA